MRIYTVHQKPGLDKRGDAQVEFVKEGLCWPALLVPFFWALYYRLWLGAIIYVVASLAFALGLELLGPGPVVSGLLFFVFRLLVAAEANNWRRLALGKRGYRFSGLVAGDDLMDAERRYFDITLRGGTGHRPANLATQS